MASAGRPSGVVVVVPPASPLLTPPRALVRTVLRPHPLPHRLPLSPRAKLAQQSAAPSSVARTVAPHCHSAPASPSVSQRAQATQYPGAASRGERP
jgi:hypothetical protein